MNHFETELCHFSIWNALVLLTIAVITTLPFSNSFLWHLPDCASDSTKNRNKGIDKISEILDISSREGLYFPRKMRFTVVLEISAFAANSA